MDFTKTDLSSDLYEEYTLGDVKLHVFDKTVVKIFVKNIKITGIDNLDELEYLCSKVNK